MKCLDILELRKEESHGKKNISYPWGHLRLQECRSRFINMSSKSLFLHILTNWDENKINLSFSRLQNPSRFFFSQNRFCKARSAGGEIWREGRGPRHTRRTRLAPHWLTLTLRLSLQNRARKGYSPCPKTFLWPLACGFLTLGNM